MKCPRDGNTLNREILAGIEIDSCSLCDGTWLDAGETAKIIGLINDMPEGKKVGLNLLPDRGPGEILMCPLCEVKLEPYYFSKEKDLIVDRCPICKGIWMDTDEVKKAIDSAYREYKKEI